MAALLTTAVAGDENEADPILSFYWKRAGETFKSRDPVYGGVSYSMRARTFYKEVNSNGAVTRVDTSVIDYYFSFGEQDSTKVILEPAGDHAEPDLEFPNIFSSDYFRYFFPNDTGGSSLAIGFDCYTAEDDRPVGLALIDRTAYYLRWMYLHYPNKPNYRRYSRSFRFVEHEGYIFPDSIWEVGTVDAVFSTENYRRETGLSDFRIYR